MSELVTETRSVEDIDDLPEWCDQGIVEQIEESISGHPVFATEEDGVWVSGINSHSRTQSRNVVDTLERHCGLIVELEYPEHGGTFIPVVGVKR